MKKRWISFICGGLVLLLILTSCGKSPNKTDSEDASSETSELSDTSVSSTEQKKEADPKEATTEKNAKLAKLYGQVLDTIGESDFNASSVNGNYSYTLVNMNDEDMPQLAVCTETGAGVAAIKFFSADNDYTNVVTNKELFSIGASAAGGFRGGMNQSRKQGSLLYTTFSAGSGDAETQALTTSVKDGKLIIKKNTIWEGKINNKEEDGSFPIDFLPVRDRSTLDKLAKTEDGKVKEALLKLFSGGKPQSQSKANAEQSANSNTLEGKKQAAVAAGKTVVTGVVKKFNHDEMVAFQKFDPNVLPDMGESYIVLLLENNVDITVHSGDPYGGYLTKSVNLVGLPEEMAAYDGQKITIAFTPDDGYWQTDVSLPMYAPRMHTSIKILK
ncbi:hypothetical protein [uncultured Levyella sp.]|uniref:hypothetical protein n=1 Tax=uncultured Levyella sp. TaxID=1715800 RepID=UPI002590288E|nr:hypothetical protein [uncultured Levyella sp.]